jgi:hypothetical protein
MKAEEDLIFKLPTSGINLKDPEVEAIRRARAMAGCKKSRAARLLGRTRDTLRYRMQKYLIRVWGELWPGPLGETVSPDWAIASPTASTRLSERGR